MEFIEKDYLINYISNIDNFTINIYNNLNNKKYELVEFDLVKKYKELGIDLFSIITDCFNKKENTTFNLDDKNNKIIITFTNHFVKISINIPNILCEYKEASVLDLKTENIKLNQRIKHLETLFSDLEKKYNLIKNIDIGDYVSVPNLVKNLIICNGINRECYGDIMNMCFKKMNGTFVLLNHVSPYSTHKNLYKGKMQINEYYNGSNLEYYLIDSPNEYFINPSTPYLCFKETIDCEYLADIELENLGLYNIKIKNINKLIHVKRLYLYNVEFLDDSILNTDIEINELGIKGCMSLTRGFLDSIILQRKKLQKIYINGSNVKKTELPTNITIIE
jgi:hypothetical protein